MKSSNTMIVAIILLGLLTANQGCQQSSTLAQRDKGETQWHTQKMENGLMSISFPEKPSKKNQTRPSAIGELKMEIYQCESMNRAFTAMSIQYPVEPTQFDAAKGLEGAINGQKANGAKVVSETDIEKDGLVGKELVVENSQGIFLRTKVYVDANGPTLFQSNVVSKSKTNLEDQTTDRFLDSIEFHTNSID